MLPEVRGHSSWILQLFLFISPHPLTEPPLALTGRSEAALNVSAGLTLNSGLVLMGLL